MPKISLKVSWDLIRGEVFLREEVVFSPDDTVYRLIRSTAYGADRIRFGCLLWIAVVAFRLALSTSDHLHLHHKPANLPYLLDDLHLTIEPRRPALNQGYPSRKTHFIHMPPCLEIIQRVEDEIEVAEPLQREVRILDIRMMRFEFDMRVEMTSRLLRDLRFISVVSRDKRMRTVPML